MAVYIQRATTPREGTSSSGIRGWGTQWHQAPYQRVSRHYPQGHQHWSKPFQSEDQWWLGNQKTHQTGAASWRRNKNNDRRDKNSKSGIEKKYKNRLQLANKIGEDAQITPKITTIEQNLSKLVIQMAAVTQRISNLEDNLQGDKNTALVNRSNKLEHESANSNIIANNFILQNFINLFVGADYYPNFNAFKQSISNYS